MNYPKKEAGAQILRKNLQMYGYETLIKTLKEMRRDNGHAFE